MIRIPSVSLDGDLPIFERTTCPCIVNPSRHVQPSKKARSANNLTDAVVRKKIQEFLANKPQWVKDQIGDGAVSIKMLCDALSEALLEVNEHQLERILKELIVNAFTQRFLGKYHMMSDAYPGDSVACLRALT